MCPQFEKGIDRHALAIRHLGYWRYSAVSPGRRREWRRFIVILHGTRAKEADCIRPTCFPNRVGPLPKKKPTQYLKDGQLFFDSIMFTGEAMRHLIAESGVGQVVLGTDYPFPWNKVPVDHILSTPGLSDDDKIAILGGTAAKLLGIEA